MTKQSKKKPLKMSNTDLLGIELFRARFIQEMNEYRGRNMVEKVRVEEVGGQRTIEPFCSGRRLGWNAIVISRLKVRKDLS